MKRIDKNPKRSATYPEREGMPGPAKAEASAEKRFATRRFPILILAAAANPRETA